MFEMTRPNCISNLCFYYAKTVPQISGLRNFHEKTIVKRKSKRLANIFSKTRRHISRSTSALYSSKSSIEMSSQTQFPGVNPNGEEVKPANPNVGSDVFEINLSNGNKHRNNDTNSKPFKIFIGYDPREDLAFEVCRYSILKRSSIPVEVLPIKQSEMRQKGVYWRERGKLESTEFSFSRFLTPYLSNYDGWAMFVDCDFLYLADIKELWDLIEDNCAIMCVQHDYAPKETTKMDGAVQTVYPRKNWSSMVLYNCGHPKNRVLTPEVVNSESGAFLHRFLWLDDHEIGSVPFVWNFLVGHNKVVENDPSTFPKAIHYTLGGPWFDSWKNCEFADLWMNEMEEYKKAMGEKEK